MSNEINMTAKLDIRHGGVNAIGDTTKTMSIGVAGEKYSNVQALTTVAEDIDTGDIDWTEISGLWLKNTSSVEGEDITILKSAVEFITLMPGQANVYSPKKDGTVWQAKSASGTPGLAVVAVGALA